MLSEASESDLLEKAEAEEKTYNWIKAAEIYEQIAVFYFEKNVINKAAEFYKKVGDDYVEAVYSAETGEEYVERCKYAMQTYERAARLFKEAGCEAEGVECEAEESFAKGTLGNSIKEAKEAFNKSYELMIESSELYSKKEDRESLARTLVKAAYSLMFFFRYCKDAKEIEMVSQKGCALAERGWRLSKEVKNNLLLSMVLFAESWLQETFRDFSNFKQKKSLEESYKNFFLRCKETLNFIKDSDDNRVHSLINATTGWAYCYFGFHFIINENEQRKYIDKGLEFFKQGLDFAKRSNNKAYQIAYIFMLNWWGLFGGRIEYIQKRIVNDIEEMLQLGKIFEHSNNPMGFFTFILPTIYYANLSQMSFLPPIQRMHYAEKAIEYGKKAVKKYSFAINILFVISSLTWSYALLATLTTDKEGRKNQIQEMLNYAHKANELGERFETGFARAGGYSSLYRAYKTLSDITETEEERVKNLSKAIDAQKKYIPVSIESRTGIILAKLRLGLLYEELGIVTGDDNQLLQAKEILFDVNKESLERGYYSYAATVHEYLARLEDRLGNHTASIENYTRAQEIHEKSLENIEYKLLKKRVKEKINYAQAWAFIEQAKLYHKREDHLKAKENYNKASEILKTIRRYNYEAPYYASWSIFEEAEKFSKEEKQSEAIEKYELARQAFENNFKTMEQTLERSKEKHETERIEKLGKVARLRVNYCSARINLEKARILSKQGNHSEAAESFALAASQFRSVCTEFKIERERKELESIYYLCRAWESMEFAEKYEEPDRFAEAALLFTKAGNIFIDTKLKFLATGNSAICEALKYGCRFDETIDLQLRTELYTKIKSVLRKATTSYRKGGSESGADWALATSTYFDALWSLIRADEELEFESRKKLLNVGSEYLNSAAKLFIKAGYKDKEKEVLTHLDMVKKEEKILVSALNTVSHPSVSRSTAGIVAPNCPIEISQSPRLGEVRQFIEEERRVLTERETKKKYEIIYRDLFKEYPRAQKRECRVAIAQIGISKTSNIINELYELKHSGLLGLREDKVEPIRSKVKSMIENAHHEGVNVLLFPELTIDLNYCELLEDISNLAKIYDMYIIPGSFHDQETGKNLSIVFGRDEILWEQEKHIPATIRIGAERFKEAIKVDDMPQKTIVCNTEYGRVAIAICRDFLDMDLRVELKNFEPPVDIILNPAFTPVTADFKAAHFDARRSIYAYCFFANVAEFGDSLIYTPEKERIERTLPAKEEGLIYKDVDIFKLRSERKKWEKERKKEKPFIQSTR